MESRVQREVGESFNGKDKGSLFERVVFKQRLEGGKRKGHGDVRRKNFLGGRRSHCKPLRGNFVRCV